MTNEENSRTKKIYNNLSEIDKSDILLRFAMRWYIDKYDFDYSKIDFIKDCNYPFTVSCKHGDHITTHSKFIKGDICKHCLKEGPLEELVNMSPERINEINKNIITYIDNMRTGRFINKAKNIYGLHYTYENTDYYDNSPIIVTCTMHGSIKVKPLRFLEGYGCSRCKHIKINNRYVEKRNCIINNIHIPVSEQYIKKAIEKHGELYDYSKTVYTNPTTDVTIICKTHGEFTQYPRDHLNGKQCPKCIRTGVSNDQLVWLRFIAKYYNINIQYHTNGGEYRVPTTRYAADGFCAETNTIYEFNGDYFHGNPDIYKDPTEINKRCNKTFKELYDKTVKKENIFRSLGYNLVVMWENDWKNINKNISRLQKHFRRQQ